MKKLSRFLFGVADIALAAMLLFGVFELVRIVFAFLDRTIPGGTDASNQIMNSVLVTMGYPSVADLSALMLVVALFFALTLIFGYFLLLQKQVFGLFIMIGLDMLGLLIWGAEPWILISIGIRWLIVGSPWLVTWIDLRRQGTLGSE